MAGRDAREAFERRLDRAARSRGPDAGAGRGGGFLNLILGLAVGLVGGPWLYGLLARPDLTSAPVAAYQDVRAQATALMPEAYVAYTDWAIWGCLALIGLIGLRMLYSIVLPSRLFWGAALGAFLWIPFGGHLLTLVPEVEEFVPEMTAGLDAVAQSNFVTERMRTVAEDMLPPASLSPATVAASTAEGAN